MELNDQQKCVIGISGKYPNINYSYLKFDRPFRLNQKIIIRQYA